MEPYAAVHACWWLLERAYKTIAHDAWQKVMAEGYRDALFAPSHGKHSLKGTHRP
jgi:hypothetical protein